MVLRYISKSVFGNGTISYLGHTVGKGIVHRKAANVSTILAFPTHTTRKDVMQFLGMAGHIQTILYQFFYSRGTLHYTLQNSGAL